MSEEDLKPDPVYDRLGRFTPDGSGIDRDEWLFQAGRASVKVARSWKWAAGVLAATQAATLAVWLAAPPPPAPGVYERPVAAQPDPQATTTPDTPDPASYGLLARTIDLDSPPPALTTPGHVVTLTADPRAELD